MKNYLKGLCKTPMVFVFIFIVCVYGFGALGETAEINRYAIVSAIGIDSVGNGENLEVSFLTFIPIAEQTFTETYKVISAQGQSISEAMDYAGLHIGRQIGLSHVKLVVFNEQLLENDITRCLDYLSRSKHMSSSTKMVVTDASAKDFLKVAEQLDSGSSVKVSELVTYNSEYIYATDSSLELFFKGLFGPTRSSVVPYLVLEEGMDNGITVSAGGGKDSGSGGSGASGGESSQKAIINNGNTIICKDAKKVAKISGKDVKNINFMKKGFNSGAIELENFSDEHFDEANLTFEIKDKKIKNKVLYKNGVPIFQIDLTLSLSLTEIDNKEGMIEENIEFFVITPQALQALEKKVRQSVADGIAIMREYKTDILDFYTIMHNTNKKEFDKFINSLEDKDDYLNHVVFMLSINLGAK